MYTMVFTVPWYFTVDFFCHKINNLLPFCTIYHADDEYLHKTGEGSVFLINAATGNEKEFVNQQIFVRHFAWTIRALTTHYLL